MRTAIQVLLLAAALALVAGALLRAPNVGADRLPVHPSVEEPAQALPDSPAQASENYRVQVIIECMESVADGVYDNDCCAQADLVSKVSILRQTQWAPNNGGRIVDSAQHNHWCPHFAVTQQVPGSATHVPVRIELWDNDLTTEDEFKIDTDDPDIALNLDVTLDPAGGCTMVGSGMRFRANCGERVWTRGINAAPPATPSPPYAGAVEFRIEVEPPTTMVASRDLYIRCLHDPVMPSYGGSVTITAQTLGPDLRPVPANNISIWQGSASQPARLVQACTVTSGCVGQVSDLPDFLSYMCTAQAGTRQVTTGWRSATVDSPALNTWPVHAVVETADPANAVDIVFIPDRNDYSNEDWPLFLRDVYSATWSAYYSEKAYLSHQNRVNFWITKDMGHYEWHEGASDRCVHELPANWDSYMYSWFDAGGIVHRTYQRDCASLADRIFAGWTGNWPVYRHEAGHQPFGLSDEYCCDGGYFVPDPLPNAYDEWTKCQDDLPDLAWWDQFLGHTGGRGCTMFKQGDIIHSNWYRSDSTSGIGDLMDNNRAYRGADYRRSEWLFARLVP